jgi:hypothetical protein
MDPITLAVPVLVVIGGKVVEKWGEKIGEKTFEAGEKLMESIGRKSPETVEKLKQLQPGDVIDAEIIEDVKQVAAADETIAAEVAATAEALKQEFGDVVNFGKIVNQTIAAPGSTVNQTFTQTINL